MNGAARTVRPSGWSMSMGARESKKRRASGRGRADLAHVADAKSKDIPKGKPAAEDAASTPLSCGGRAEKRKRTKSAAKRKAPEGKEMPAFFFPSFPEGARKARARAAARAKPPAAIITERWK